MYNTGAILPFAVFLLSQQARELLLIRHALQKWPTLKSFSASGLLLQSSSVSTVKMSMCSCRSFPQLRSVHVNETGFVISAVEVKLQFWCTAHAHALLITTRTGPAPHIPFLLWLLLYPARSQTAARDVAIAWNTQWLILWLYQFCTNTSWIMLKILCWYIILRRFLLITKWLMGLKYN